MYLRDLRTGETTLVSSNAEGADSANDGSGEPVFSPDGTKLAFTSRATDLGPTDADPGADVYVRDLATAGLTRVPNVPDDCPVADTGDAQRPVFSADGTMLVFDRDWWDDWDDPVGQDVFVHDLTTGATVAASPRAGGVSCGRGESLPSGFSPDGTKLVFTSTAADLGPVDDNGASDVFVRDLGLGSTRLVSESSTHPGARTGHPATLS